MWPGIVQYCSKDTRRVRGYRGVIYLGEIFSAYLGVGGSRVCCKFTKRGDGLHVIAEDRAALCQVSQILYLVYLTNSNSGRDYPTCCFWCNITNRAGPGIYERVPYFLIMLFFSFP